MNREKLLIKNTAIVSIGKICTQLITFFLLPLYTAVLSTEEYGVVDLLNTLVGLFLPIVTLQIEQGVFRYLLDCRDNEKEQKTIISSTVFFLIVQSIIYLVCFVIVSQWIHNDYKYFLAINLIANIFSAVLLQISRGLGDNTSYAIGSFLSGAVTVILNVIFIVVFKMGAYGMLTATLIGNLLCSLYIIFRKKIYKSVSTKANDTVVLKKILKYSIHLVPNMISWWVVNASDRTIISSVLGIEKNGIFSAASKFSVVITTLYSVVNLTWTESAALNIEAEDKDKFFSKMFDFNLRFFGSLCLGIIAFLPFVFGLLINEKFGEAYYQIPILLIGAIFNVIVSFLGSIYVAKKITKEIAKTSILAAIINIVVNLATIKWLGLYAASISTVVAYMSMAIYRFVDSRKYVKISLNYKFLISILVMFAITMVAYYVRNTVICAIIALAVVIYTIFVNRKNVKFVIDMVRKFIKR